MLNFGGVTPWKIQIFETQIDGGFGWSQLTFGFSSLGDFEVNQPLMFRGVQQKK